MKLLGRQRTHLLLGSLIFFCLFNQSFSQEALSAAPKYEDPHHTLAKRMDLFGGLYYDTDGVLTLLLKTGATSIPGREISLSSAELTRVKSIITDVFSPEHLLPVKKGLAQVPTLRVRTSKYKFTQLELWHEQISDSPTSIAMITAVGIGERDNQMVVSVGLEESIGPATKDIENLLEQLAIPRDAVVIEEVGIAYGSNGGGSP